ncbi:MAG: coproporphyrinogen III oxidase family protein [Treponema sp.]|jgi:oxygen-independent coproporphyrinogen-3 oxidase|nr:coproporphyrinogen III oxidase family protein [Treponema sp.]
MEASLYIHVPFCRGICDYCDFYSVPAEPRDRRLDLFVDAVCTDVEDALRSPRNKAPRPLRLPRAEGSPVVDSVPAVYIGGGTPSVLGAGRMARLLPSLNAALPLSPQAREFTVEANPESADRGFLEACRNAGVNRVSLGVQTFHEPSRRAVRRAGGGDVLPSALSLVREIFGAGGASFSADLITGLPFQDEKILRKDIESLLAYDPGHVSLYSLTLAPGTPLKEKGGVSLLPPADEADRLWLAGRDLLLEAGYEQYEVSSFAKPAFRCVHNIRYWRMKNWLGVGPAASGTVIDDASGTGFRFTVNADADLWLASHERGRRADQDAEFLDALTLMKETFLMGFRFTEGPDAELFFKRFGRTIEETIPGVLEKWRNRGFLREKDGSAGLTGEGLLFLNSFLLDVFTEIDLRRGSMPCAKRRFH